MAKRKKERKKGGKKERKKERKKEERKEGRKEGRKEERKKGRKKERKGKKRKLCPKAQSYKCDHFESMSGAPGKEHFILLEMALILSTSV